MWNPFKKDLEPEFYQGEMVNEVVVGDQSVSVGPESFENEGHQVKLRQAVRIILLALVFLVPIFILPFTAPGDVLVPSKQILIFSSVFASVALWLALIVRQGGVRLKTSGLEIGILVYLAAELLAAIFSGQVFRSFLADRGFIMTASLAVFSFLLLNFFEKQEIKKIVNYFTVGAFLAILGGLLSLYGLPVFKWITGFQFNSVGSANNLGALAVLTLVLACVHYFSSLSWDQNSGLASGAKLDWFMSVIRLGAVIVSAIFLLILNWWVFYAVLAIGMVGIIFSLGSWQGSWEAKSKFKAANLIGPLVILALSILLLTSGRYFNFDFPGRQNLPVEITISQTGSWEIAKGVFSTHLPFGVGQNNFPLAFDQYKPSGINNSTFWNTRFGNATSELWNLIIQTGLVGLGGFVLLLFFVFRLAFQKHAFNFGSTSAQMASGWPLALPAFLAAVGLFTIYPFSLVLNFVFWLLIGLCALSISKDEEGKLKVILDEISLKSIFTSLAFVLVLVFGLMGGYLIFKNYQGEFYFAKAARMNLVAAGDVDQAIGLLGQSVNASQDELRYLSGLAQLLLTRINLELHNKKDKPEEIVPRVQNLTRLAVQTASQMITNKPKDAQNWSSAGFVYENLIGFLVGGADQAALDAYTEYLKRSPYDPAIYTRVGNIYLRRADALRSQQGEQNQKQITEGYKKAEENYKKAIELKSDLASSLYNLGVVYDRQAQTKNAIKQLELTKLLDPNNAGLAFELGLLYYRDGQKDNALAEMARAVNLSKDYVNARWYLALLLEEKGRIDLAIAQLKEILKTDVNKDNQTVIDKLASLEAGRRELPPARVTSKVPLEETVNRHRSR